MSSPLNCHIIADLLTTFILFSVLLHQSGAGRCQGWGGGAGGRGGHGESSKISQSQLLSLRDSQSQLSIAGDDRGAGRGGHGHPAPDHCALRLLPLALRPEQQEHGHREQRWA